VARLRPRKLRPGSTRHDGSMSDNPYSTPPADDEQPPRTPDVGATPTPPQSAVPAAAPPPPGPPVAYAPTTVPTETLAIWAFVCAIGSWVLCPVVLAIVALVLAKQADAAITAAAGWKQGRGMVTAARVIAWIHLALAAMAVVFLVAFFVGLAIGN